MSAIIKRYFVAEGDKASKVAEEGLRLSKETREAGITLAKKHGAIGTFGRGHGAPLALVWDEGRVPDPNPGFLPPELHFEGDQRYQVCRPNKRTKLGKELHALFQSLPVFNFSDYACSEFSVHHCTISADRGSRTGMVMYHSVAGYMQEKLVFSIPFGGDQGGGKVIDVDIPPEFREITAGEFMAITKGGAA